MNFTVFQDYSSRTNMPSLHSCTAVHKGNRTVSQMTEVTGLVWESPALISFGDTEFP